MVRLAAGPSREVSRRTVAPLEPGVGLGASELLFRAPPDARPNPVAERPDRPRTVEEQVQHEGVFGRVTDSGKPAAMLRQQRGPDPR